MFERTSHFLFKTKRIALKISTIIFQGPFLALRCQTQIAILRSVWQINNKEGPSPFILLQRHAIERGAFFSISFSIDSTYLHCYSMQAKG